MKKFLIVFGIVLAVSAAGVSIIAAKYESTVRPNTLVGIVPVGGLTKEEAKKKVRIWWESQKLQPLQLTSKLFRSPLPPMTPGQLGISLDDAASVDQIPMSDFWDAAQGAFSGPADRKIYPVVYKKGPAALDKLKSLVKGAMGEVRPATVKYAGGVITRSPEVTSFELDEAQLSDLVLDAVKGDGKVEVPVKEAPKHIPDEALDKITDVVSEYSTRFPAYQSSRNTNIRLAAQKLSGHILMPGETLSFNQTVGQRTVKGGYREAPVLMNGKHDTGIGGGICQVSTTLYNATLLSDLKIVQRQNHSVPSVYVPVGRDATVDWPNLDLVIQNNRDVPIAIVSSYEAGRITFRVLGQKDPSEKVAIVTSGLKSWDRGEQIIKDPTLPAGKKKIIEKGSAGRSINVYRVVYKDGVEVRREHLGTSRYVGMKRIVAVGTKGAPVASVPSTTPVPPAPAGNDEAPDPLTAPNG